MINKPPGISVHPVRSNPPLSEKRGGAVPLSAGQISNGVHEGNRVQEETVVDFLLENFPEIRNVGDEPDIRPGIVHRLDKNTSGIMIVARHQQSFATLKELFKKRLVEKTYLALVCGRLNEKRGMINMPIGRVVKNPLKRGVVDGSGKIRGEREAVTEYRVLKEGGEYSLLELKPKTGRMHQLRVHLKAIGHPVACDIIYGGKKVCCPEGAERHLLHAQALAFSFPEGRKFKLEADAPTDFRVALKQIFR